MSSNAADLGSLMTTYEAAKHLRLAPSTLNKMRVNGGGPAYLKLGLRRVGYELDELEKWKNKRRFFSTSQYPVVSTRRKNGGG